MPRAASAAAHIVTPGQSIQAAIDAAASGDVVKVMPGTYVETHGNAAALRITKRLKLIAKSTPDDPVVLQPGAGNLHGVLVEPEMEGDPDINGFLISGFTIEGFEKMGIWLRHVNKFKIKNNVSANNLENGIFPTLSAKGLVKKNVSYGSLDSGLWVEASENVRVIKNELYNNPTGLEVTVSKNIFAKGNDIHDNTVGVGLYHPNGASLDPLGDDGDWKIIGNHIYDNNFPNPVSGGLVGQLPYGIGVLVIGVDEVTVFKNIIENNDTIGVTVLNWCIFNDCVGDPPKVDQYPDNVSVIANTITGNGGDPHPDFADFANDLFFFSFGGSGVCFSGNTTTLPPVGIPTLPGEC